MSLKSLPNKKATQSLNQRLFLTWVRVSKNQDHYKIE